MNLLQLAASLAIAAWLSVRGFRRGSLDLSGATVALVVGTLHMYCGLQYGLTLIFFYLSSSKLTRLQSEKKAQLEAGHKAGGQRNAVQVLSNSAGACAAMVAMLLMRQGQQEALGALHAALMGAFLGHYACCCADTWASEVGILARSWPRLITSGRRVPPGTNGAVSPLGLCFAAVGGCSVGFVFWAADALSRALSSASSQQPLVIPSLAQAAGPARVAAACLALGLAGCTLDSLLGATLQFSGRATRSGRVVQVPGPGVARVAGFALLSNDAVNFVAAGGTAVLGAWAARTWWLATDCGRALGVA
ncbi:hypothetical protein FOA52_011517 [Chlamydomonas sp. UWO 241]|nr:hypothetical protein FOA52_011517 [Chlamydomonas sp. UWO 241]